MVGLYLGAVKQVEEDEGKSSSSTYPSSKWICAVAWIEAVKVSSPLKALHRKRNETVETMGKHRLWLLRYVTIFQTFGISWQGLLTLQYSVLKPWFAGKKHSCFDDKPT
jgi:hypothetical protein